MAAYYNEFDKHAAAWLRELIAAGMIPAGEVDERDIREVQPCDLFMYDQCHFFAGIGGWPLALEMASWPDGATVWTGSCPCQPFSAAGKRKGTADERHLWPEFRRLIAECKPPVVFGEQVASKDGRGWLAGVRADLEALGYGVGAADLCAPGAGAPHIRQRLWWVGDAERDDLGRVRRSPPRTEKESDSIRQINGSGRVLLGPASPTRGMGNPTGDDERRAPESAMHRQGCEVGGSSRDGSRLVDSTDHGEGQGQQPSNPEGCGGSDDRGPSSVGGGMGDPDSQREDPLDRVSAGSGTECERGAVGMEYAAGNGREQGRSEPVRRIASVRRGEGFWGEADYLHCTDGKHRPVEPGTFPLAHGVSGRVGLLRGYGNAIVPQVAATFIEAYLETQI